MPQRLEVARRLENNPDPEERRDGIVRHFKNLLRVKRDLDRAIDELFEEYPYLEEPGPNGRSLAQKARKELEKERQQ